MPAGRAATIYVSGQAPRIRPMVELLISRSLLIGVTSGAIETMTIPKQK
jgi:hypothetical protein